MTKSQEIEGMSDACKICKGTDFTDGGKCRPCQRKRNQAYRIKHAGSAVKAKTKAKEVKPAAISAPVPGARFTLVIEQGYGLTAAIDEEYLIVTQHDGETGDDDKICLSRSELRQLIAKFADWAQA